MRLSMRACAALAGMAAAGAILAACSTADVMRPDIDVVRTAALVAPAPTRQSLVAPGPGMQALVPSNPWMTDEPEEREAAPQPMIMPRSEVDCRDELRSLGATFRDLAPIDDGGACRVDWPVELSSLSGDIAMKPAATLSCPMAVAIARWTKKELGPSTRLRYLTGVKAIHQASSYSCRRIARSSTISEHAKGNALDIARIELDDGRNIGVRKPGFFRFREKSLLNNVRADACDYFSTVLGPGYNHDHRDHFHFDIASRRNGRRACH